MVQRPQKPKIDHPDSPTDPLLGHFVRILGHFGVKKRIFLEKICFAPNHICGGSPMVQSPQKLKIDHTHPVCRCFVDLKPATHAWCGPHNEAYSATLSSIETLV